MPQLLFAFEGLDPANQSGLQPLGLFLFMSLRDRAANLALDTIPKRLPLIGIEVDECAAFVEALFSHDHLGSFAALALCTDDLHFLFLKALDLAPSARLPLRYGLPLSFETMSSSPSRRPGGRRRHQCGIAPLN
ncbi:hypothetical protein [Mesorhizobium sp. L103C131B0]|uniref:hypothetical protein n=1 Tax=Mesorhizobium sp. L103C131B0 TaxID=1287089 RepID=UPI0003CFC365|nr:hypothetical protein [Mesorhizobium sp. L103C131B0]ESZ54124.1 hypothetical protein X729_29765 [Mesorhizobium sp. L103C131B0]